MKSTYQLFGAYWDGMGSCERGDIWSEKSRPADSGGNVVSFRDLLGVEKKDDLQKLLSSLDSRDPVRIRIDYRPESSNPVLRGFLEKRLRQMVFHLSEFFPIVSVDAEVPTEDRSV